MVFKKKTNPELEALKKEQAAEAAKPKADTKEVKIGETNAEIDLPGEPLTLNDYVFGATDHEYRVAVLGLLQEIKERLPKPEEKK